MVGYEDSLYNINNLVAEFLDAEGQLVGALVENDKSFGFINNQGRRIAMHSADYDLQLLGSNNDGTADEFREVIGETVIFDNAMIPDGFSLRVLNDEGKLSFPQEDFENLFNNNLEIQDKYKLYLAKAVFDYSQESSHEPSHESNEVTKILEAMEEAAHEFLKVTRPNTQEDRDFAKQQYDNVPADYVAEVSPISSFAAPTEPLPTAVASRFAVPLVEDATGGVNRSSGQSSQTANRRNPLRRSNTI